MITSFAYFLSLYIIAEVSWATILAHFWKTICYFIFFRTTFQKQLISFYSEQLWTNNLLFYFIQNNVNGTGAQLSILTPNVGYYEWRHIYPPAHARASASRSLPNSDYGSRGKFPCILVVVKISLINLVDDSVTMKSMLYVISCHFRMYMFTSYYWDHICHEFLF